MSRRRASRRSDPHACLTPGCGTIIPGWQRICTACFKRLPFEKRQAIAQAGQAKATHVVAGLVIEAVRWLVADDAARSAQAAASTARMMGERDG